MPGALRRVDKREILVYHWSNKLKADVISVYGPKVSTATPKVVTIGKDVLVAFLYLQEM